MKGKDIKDNRNGETVHEVLDVHPSLLECQAQKCKKSIRDRYFLKAMGKYWHEDCLKCDLCDCRLGEVDCHLYTKFGQKYCKLDYLRLFGPRGVCAACHREIKAYELVMNTTVANVYHLECFKCSDCEKPFCVGEKYHLRGSRVICDDHK